MKKLLFFAACCLAMSACMRKTVQESVVLFDADAFETAIETYINNFSQDYDPNVDLSAEDNSVISISWSWPFSTSDANDVKDTALGDAADAGNAATISIRVDCTVTQID